MVKVDVEDVSPFESSQREPTKLIFNLKRCSSHFPKRFRDNLFPLFANNTNKGGRDPLHPT